MKESEKKEIISWKKENPEFVSGKRRNSHKNLFFSCFSATFSVMIV
jgi:hypothetical protein